MNGRFRVKIESRAVVIESVETRIIYILTRIGGDLNSLIIRNIMIDGRPMVVPLVNGAIDADETT